LKNITGNAILPSGQLILNGYLISNTSNLTDVSLNNVNLNNINLSNANLTNIWTENITGNVILPTDYSLINGRIVGSNVNLSNMNLGYSDLSNKTFAHRMQTHLNNLAIVSIC
jgi:uncharacterized protein YjbI with pentapeptide repeats